jgi:hypothetical protein
MLIQCASEQSYLECPSSQLNLHAGYEKKTVAGKQEMHK